MGIIKKQSILSSIYNYSGVVIGFAIVVLLFPRFLDRDQIGLLKLLLAYSLVFMQVASLGLNSITIRLFPYFRNKENGHNGYLSLLLIVGLVGFGLMVVIFFIIKP